MPDGLSCFLFSTGNRSFRAGVDSSDLATLLPRATAPGFLCFKSRWGTPVVRSIEIWIFRNSVEKKTNHRQRQTLGSAFRILGKGECIVCVSCAQTFDA
jgi:hypothetical protein